MLKRILTSVVAICVLVPALIFSGTIVFPIAIGVVTLLCLYEMFKCAGLQKRWALLLPAYVFGAVAPLLLRYIENTSWVALLSFIVAALYLIYVFAFVVWSHGKLLFGDTMAVTLMAMYIVAAMSSILYVRDFDEGGKYLYLLIFIGAWITDTFAYFTGYFFGKHKLIEDVSPKKTVEGSIGGILFCVAAFAVFGLVVDTWFDRDANLLLLMLSGFVISLIAQIGDLIMSVIKRHYQIKDFGKIFPGHGGMLDRFDSILAVSLGLGAVCMFSVLTGIRLI
ncbi:MAG: phosphatidate cytidylyltransferase [Clostridia bacterium]|nr:phosphatidate cytidylyltransferase [Clostridia bacterium]